MQFLDSLSGSLFGVMCCTLRRPVHRFTCSNRGSSSNTTYHNGFRIRRCIALRVLQSGRLGWDHRFRRRYWAASRHVMGSRSTSIRNATSPEEGFKRGGSDQPRQNPTSLRSLPLCPLQVPLDFPHTVPPQQCPPDPPMSTRWICAPITSLGDQVFTPLFKLSVSANR